MRTYKSLIEDLTTVLDDAVNIAEDKDSVEEKLARIDVKRLKDIADDYSMTGSQELDNLLSKLTVLADESGERRRAILAHPKPPYQKGAYSTKSFEFLSSFGELSAISILLLKPQEKYLHCFYHVNIETQKVVRVTFNETLYNPDDPAMIGSINLLNEVERGLELVKSYK